MKKLTEKPLNSSGRNHNGVIEITGCAQLDGELEPLIVLRGSDPLARRILKTWIDEATKADYPERVVQQMTRLHDRCERRAAIDGSRPPAWSYVEETVPTEATPAPKKDAPKKGKKP